MRRLLGMLAVALLAGGFSSAESPREGTTSAVGPVVEGNTAFALELYRQLNGEPGNLFFSPYSISSALAMTHLGARGTTAAEMQTTLRFPAEEKLHPAFAALNAQINAETNKKRGYHLTVANAIWGQQKYPWNKDFLAATDRFYGAGLQEVDFIGATEKSRVTINQWVEKRTQEKIKDLLKPGILTTDTRMVLTNAIHFKGDWAAQFKKDLTRERNFRLDTTRTVKTPLMYQRGEFALGEDEQVQVLRLPYVGKELEMVVILPRKVDGLATVEKDLTVANLNRWVQKTRVVKVEVTLPKFKVEMEFSLKQALSKMGMPTAFISGKADFSGMATAERLNIAEVVHKAFVDVNEEGTEAAAATAVIIEARSVPRIEQFVADHPFLFLIRDTRNGSLLFLGRFSDPG